MLTNLSTILRQKGLLTLSQEESLMEQMKASGIDMPEALLNSGLFASNELTEHLSIIFGLQQISLLQFDYTPPCNQLGLRELITHSKALPIAKNGQILTVAVTDPTDISVEDDFRSATGLQIELVLAISP